MRQPSQQRHRCKCHRWGENCEGCIRQWARLYIIGNTQKLMPCQEDDLTQTHRRDEDRHFIKDSKLSCINSYQTHHTHVHMLTHTQNHSYSWCSNSITACSPCSLIPPAPLHCLWGSWEKMAPSQKTQVLLFLVLMRRNELECEGGTQTSIAFNFLFLCPLNFLLQDFHKEVCKFIIFSKGWLEPGVEGLFLLLELGDFILFLFHLFQSFIDFPLRDGREEHKITTFLTCWLWRAMHFPMQN